MKVLNAEQIRQADAYTIKNQPIASLDLMEQAATRCFEAILENLGDKIEGQPLHFYCGIGNNGGDGLVLARLFHKAGYEVNIYICRYSNKSTNDFKVNLERLKGFKVNIKNIDMQEDLENHDRGWIIDAIFGTGLNRPPRGIAASTIKHINHQNLPVISVDTPSGLFSDKPAHNDEDKTVSASYTFGFQVPKLSFLMPENYRFVGEWFIVDIGLDKDFIEQIESDLYYLIPERVKSMLRKRKKFEHKGDYGHALIAGGDVEKAGAAILAGKGALRSGAGLVTLMVPEKIMATVHAAAPELMCVPAGDEYLRGWDKKKLPKDITALGIGAGPGMGTRSRTHDFLKEMLEDSFDPIVLDADALNILAADPKLLNEVPANSILTPHIGEFRRLAGDFKNGYEMLDRQIAFSTRHKLIVVLKGAHTRISTPGGRVFFNSTGNPGLATGGSGDVLTGIITGLLKQYRNPVRAAIIGVYLHGFAADLALEEQCMDSLIASDILKYIGRAFKQLHKN